MRTKEPTRTVNIRIPASLHRWVAVNAKKEHRSFNGQVGHLLQNMVDEQTEAKQGGAA